MYHIKPESILTFLKDKSIRFPRFQRKQTWKDEQNFKLVVSVFKNYPIGVTIINKQTFGSTSTRWLLDGRQRRTALEKMYQDPENIYLWSKKFLGIKNSDQPKEIDDKFWSKMEVYLNDTDEAGFLEAKKEAERKGEKEFFFDGTIYYLSSSENVEEDYDGDFSDDDLDLDENHKTEDDLFVEYNRNVWGNLDELLFIIRTIHKKTSNKSGFTSPFDFKSYIPNLTYSVDGNKVLSGQKLRTFISEFLQYCEDENVPDYTSKNLVQFYQSRYQLNTDTLNKLSSKINQNWNEIENSIKVFTIIRNRLHEGHIGIIETYDITATDSQMIFTLINKEGTKLSAVEILSAKPAWNIPVKSPSKEVERERKLLYSAINTEQINTVRWDYPATVYDRLTSLNFLLPKLDYSQNNQLERKLTLGFKILSGVYNGGIKKEDVDKLATNKNISWDTDIDSLVSELQLMGKVLESAPYFSFLKGLDKTFMEITSDAITLNYLFTLYHDFKKKGSPAGNSTQAKIFIHNATILADRMVYEYATFKWRGSSDSKVAKNISSFSTLDDKFVAVEDKSWTDLFKSINDKYSIDDSNITFGLSKTIVYHVYAMMGIGCADADSFDIDHIIPQSAFNKSNINKSELIQNALFNLCPLPRKQNIKKSDAKLNSIEDQWLLLNIEHFSKIKKKDFDKFSKVTNWEELRTLRRNFYEIDFNTKRKEIFNN